MAAPPVIERHKPHFHQKAPILEACRAATTASITISTALNNGDTLDGITLATGDRVLVKDQSTGSQNGIYVVGATPVRAYDLDTDEPNFGFLVFVREGTINGGTRWQNTNTTAPTIGSTSITFTSAAASTSFGTPALTLTTTNAAGAASTAIRTDASIALFDATVPTTQALGDAAATGSAAFAARRDHKHAMPAAAVTSSGLTQATARLLGRTSASTGAIEEITVGTGLSLSAGSLTATGGAGVTYGTPAIVLGTAAANGSIDEAIRRDSTIIAFDVTAPVTQAIGDSAATGSQAVASRRDHKHGMPSFGGTGSSANVARSDHTHGGGGGSSAIYPLDNYVNAFVSSRGDDFTSASLDAMWTLRNFVTGDLSFQQGYNATWLRMDPTGQAVGDGLLRSDPGGDLQWAAKIIHRGTGSGAFGLLPAMVDSSGTGVGVVMYTNPLAVLLTRITTYSTYQGTYVEIGNSGTNPNVAQLPTVYPDQPFWVRIRVSGTNFILSYSLDGEIWSHESGNLAATFTRDRMGALIHPLTAAIQGDDRYDLDWMGQIA